VSVVAISHVNMHKEILTQMPVGAADAAAAGFNCHSTAFTAHPEFLTDKLTRTGTAAVKVLLLCQNFAMNIIVTSFLSVCQKYEMQKKILSVGLHLPKSS